MPVLPSYDSVAQMTRSGDSALMAAASALPVSNASAPASFSSVMTIFTTKPPFGGRGDSIIARSDRRPETQVVVRRVEAADDVAVDVLQPRHLHAGEHFRRASVATVQRRADDRQRRLSVCRTYG